MSATILSRMLKDLDKVYADFAEGQELLRREGILHLIDPNSLYCQIIDFAEANRNLILTTRSYVNSVRNQEREPTNRRQNAIAIHQKYLHRNLDLLQRLMILIVHCFEEYAGYQEEYDRNVEVEVEEENEVEDEVDSQSSDEDDGEELIQF